MHWFRFYHEVLDDPKVQQLPAELFRHWVNLLCLANMAKDRGTLAPDITTIAFRLRVSDVEAMSILAELRERGLLDTNGNGTITPHNWPLRQFKSDNSAERVARHRANKRDGNVTSPLPETAKNPPETGRNVTVTPPDTDTDTDTETEPNRVVPNTPPAAVVRRDYPADFETFWHDVVRKEPSKQSAYTAWVKAQDRVHATANGKAVDGAAVILDGLRRVAPLWRQFPDPSKIPHITTWLNQDRWTVEQPTGPPRGSPNPTNPGSASMFDLAAKYAKEGR